MSVKPGGRERGGEAWGGCVVNVVHLVFHQQSNSCRVLDPVFNVA